MGDFSEIRFRTIIIISDSEQLLLGTGNKKCGLVSHITLIKNMFTEMANTDTSLKHKF